jgi:high-affinity iron transporter
LLNILDTKVWDMSWLLSQDGWVGRVLHVLIGYMDRPTGMQLIAYAITACTIFGLAYWRGSPRPARSSVGA